MFTHYSHDNCIETVIYEMHHEINMRHYDYYLYPDKTVAFEGDFVNNKPNGRGLAKDERGHTIWSGNFVDGMAEICLGRH